jgi:hypothetical protein
MAKQSPVGERAEQATIGLPIPAPEPELFRHKATNDVLRLLLDNPYDQFTIRELSRLTDNATQSVKRAVDVLEPNGIVDVNTDGNRRLVGINRRRVTKPDDPILHVPQPEFHPPVRPALAELREELDEILGVPVV